MFDVDRIIGQAVLHQPALTAERSWTNYIAAFNKPGPKRTNEDGTPDKRQRVTPEKQKDHPDLKPHKHKKGE